MCLLLSSVCSVRWPSAELRGVKTRSSPASHLTPALERLSAERKEIYEGESKSNHQTVRVLIRETQLWYVFLCLVYLWTEEYAPLLCVAYKSSLIDLFVWSFSAFLSFIYLLGERAIERKTAVNPH